MRRATAVGRSRLAGGRDIAGGERCPDALEQQKTGGVARAGKSDDPFGGDQQGKQAAGESAEKDGDEGRPAEKCEHQHQHERQEMHERGMKRRFDPHHHRRRIKIAGRAEAPEECEGDDK